MSVPFPSQDIVLPIRTIEQAVLKSQDLFGMCATHAPTGARARAPSLPAVAGPPSAARKAHVGPSVRLPEPPYRRVSPVAQLYHWEVVVAPLLRSQLQPHDCCEGCVHGCLGSPLHCSPLSV